MSNGYTNLESWASCSRRYNPGGSGWSPDMTTEMNKAAEWCKAGGATNFSTDQTKYGCNA